MCRIHYVKRKKNLTENNLTNFYQDSGTVLLSNLHCYVRTHKYFSPAVSCGALLKFPMSQEGLVKFPGSWYEKLPYEITQIYYLSLKNKFKPLFQPL